jgi:hypothetical protein
MIVAGVLLVFIFREMARRRPKVETFDTDSPPRESAGQRKRRRKARK